MAGDGLRLRALLDDALGMLQASAHVPDARQEALWLIEHALERPSTDIIARPGSLVSPQDAARVRALARRRADGEPLQYVLGDAHFLGHRFICDARALIPRPETEVLAEHAIELLGGACSGRIADVCTGSGCIAISVALALPEFTVEATDISAEALELASENARLHAVSDRVRLARGDLFAPLTGRFDAVLINPPYIPSQDIDAIGVDIAMEPRQALDGGPDGLDFYRRIAMGYRSLLAPGGFVAVEVGAGQADSVTALMDADTCSVIQDLSGVARVLVCRIR